MFKVMFILVAAGLLVGCANEIEEHVTTDDSSPAIVYFAIEEDDLEDDRWQNFIKIAVDDDIITYVSLNSISILANTSRRDAAQLTFFETILDYNFYEQADLLESTLVGLSYTELAQALRDAYDNQSVDFDTRGFADLATRALASDPLERGPFLDGFYMSINDAIDESLTYFVHLFVVHGHIKAVHFNAFDVDNALKYDVFTGETVGEHIVEWRRQAELFEEALLNSQDPMAFTFDEQGLSTDIPGFYLWIEPFITLATEALAQGPVIH
ncbi:MAG: hypothetical protein FWG67_07320 [Defluviitaleaceae bacterium]|nr:hypothetical protein [Defluviitaleaceae bacterium]